MHEKGGKTRPWEYQLGEGKNLPSWGKKTGSILAISKPSSLLRNPSGQKEN